LAGKAKSYPMYRAFDKVEPLGMAANLKVVAVADKFAIVTVEITA
jgi:hypothetical protein